MLDMFSFEYFMWILLFILIIIGTYFGFRNRSERFKYYLLFGLACFTWVVHFSRYWLEPNLMTYELFFLDLCGFSTMVYPLFMVLKNKAFKDYMYFVGGFFALHSMVYPNNIEGDPIFAYNTIRFFFAHTILVMIPILLIAWKMHRPSIKNIGWMICFVLIGAMYNVTISSVHYYTGTTSYLRNYMGLWGNTNSVYQMFEVLAPHIRYDHYVNGELVNSPYPFFYMIPALIIFYTPIWVLMSLPFIKTKKAN